MPALRLFGRSIAFLVGLALLAAGAVALGAAHAPEAAAVKVARALLAKAAVAVGGLFAAGLSGEAVVSGLADGPGRFAAAGVGLALLLFAVFPRRARSRRQDGGREDALPPLDRFARRRAEKQIKGLIRGDRIREAADLCFTTDQLDRAVELYLRAGDAQRAAEIRHDQNRFDEAAALYRQAGRLEPAATIYAERGQHAEAARVFEEAGRRSVAAEMYAKAGQHAEAARCFREAGFHRHAAQAYVRCQDWGEAATCLEQVIAEEGAKAISGDPQRDREFRKLVLQCGRLYEQAGALERAAEVLERGGCLALAAELALRLQRFAKASELFQRAGEVLKASDALRRLGEDRAAAQLQGEYHRDRGDDEQAAAAFEEAGDHLAAGELYRKLQEFARAGECFERNRDPIQAAEMFRLSGDAARAARCYESAQQFADAAACWSEAGDPGRQAEMLVRAGRFLEAGGIFLSEGRQDEAIKVLQKLEADHPDAARASAMLGHIFKEKGMHSLSIVKLRQALGEAELTQENIEAFYTLAVVYEANRQLRDAAELYEKILACDYHYRDVEDRLEASREKARLAERNEGTASGPGSGASASSAGNARYQILAELGRGGMGIVYKAQDTVLDRVVAYKVLPDALTENPQALKNFLREAKSAAQLNHPNIVTVYDAGEQDGRYYIAMEYVDGTTLKEIVRRRGAIAPGGVALVLAQMCAALAYAHEKKIVHRDIKTANTMWTREKNAKIMDFGLAKVMEEVRNHTTLVSGTPYYMSPEQTLGKNIDHRTDLYSLGVTLFELCTGRLPFLEGNVPYHHVHTPPPEVKDVNPAVPEVLASIVRRCLQKDPAARYGSAREILAELRAARTARG